MKKPPKAVGFRSHVQTNKIVQVEGGGLKIILNGEAQFPQSNPPPPSPKKNIFFRFKNQKPKILKIFMLFWLNYF